jgi:1-acyl-sn-glycerol-3-phosphate acyltransferase
MSVSVRAQPPRILALVLTEVMQLLVRGWIAAAFASVALGASDPVQRFVISPWVRLRPSRRISVLGRWLRMMAWLCTRPVAFLGGFKIPRPPRIVPAKPGVLVVMNHQSVFDIPLVIQTMADGYLRIVTRKRYSRRIPLISHMIGLYEYPVVDPSANSQVLRDSLDQLEAAAKETDVPLAVFPEGTRTRDGEIGRFKRGALTRILAARPWTVYLFVADGFWKTAKYKDFVRGTDRIEGKMEHVATLEWSDPAADSDPFVGEMHRLMTEHLRVMRSGAEAA